MSITFFSNFVPFTAHFTYILQHEKNNKLSKISKISKEFSVTQGQENTYNA